MLGVCSFLFSHRCRYRVVVLVLALVLVALVIVLVLVLVALVLVLVPMRVLIFHILVIVLIIVLVTFLVLVIALDLAILLLLVPVTVVDFPVFVLVDGVVSTAGGGPVSIGPPPRAGGRRVRHQREDQGGARHAHMARGRQRCQRASAGVRGQHGRVDDGIRSPGHQGKSRVGSPGIS